MSITWVRSFQSDICSTHLTFQSGRGKSSALYLASVARDLEMVEILLEHGARTDIFGGVYDNPLQVASKNGDIAIVQALLNAGVDVNRKGGRFKTALVSACRYKQISVVAALLNHDADPNIQGCWECDNALQAACEQDNAQIVLLLLEHEANPNLHGGWYGSALHAAFSKGNTTIIQSLLTKGANVRYKGGEFHSVLHAAVESGNEAAVRLALDCGLSPNEKGGWFTYPLLRATAVETCPDSIVRLLLEEGADPNLEREGDDFIDHTFRTPLQHATSISKASLLMDAGAKINTVSGWLGTALHVAIYAGGKQKSSMIKFLTDHGADVNKVAENVGSPLCYAGREDDLSSAKLLIEAGADLDSVDTIGHSALHMAICKSKSGMELFDFFVDLGANPLLLDLRGCNGLHYAGRANNLGALKKILEREPDINATDDFGWTPLHWAAASTRKTARVVKTLLDEGCNKDLKDKAERTALDLATMFDNTGVVAILKTDADAEPLDTNVTVTKEPMNYECDGCGIVRKTYPSPHLTASEAKLRYKHRYRICVHLSLGISAWSVTLFSISASDASRIRTSYMPEAILGPIRFPRLSNGRGSLSCGRGELRLCKCISRTHGWICLGRLRWIVYSFAVVSILHSKVSRKKYIWRMNK